MLNVFSRRYPGEYIIAVESLNIYWPMESNLVKYFARLTSCYQRLIFQRPARPALGIYWPQRIAERPRSVGGRE